LSGTKTNLDFTEARDSEWQWHQLGHMQACTSLQTDNYASTLPLSFLQARRSSCRPTNIIKAVKRNGCKNPLQECRLRYSTPFLGHSPEYTSTTEFVMDAQEDYTYGYLHEKMHRNTSQPLLMSILQKVGS